MNHKYSFSNTNKELNLKKTKKCRNDKVNFVSFDLLLKNEKIIIYLIVPSHAHFSTAKQHTTF
jgi:hypothetical protein